MQKMLKISGLIFTLFLASFSNAQDTEVIVVASISDKELRLDKREVRNVFMGGVSQYKLKPVELSPSNYTRLVFNTKIIGLTESRIQSYWAQMRFSGRNKPPKQMESVDEILDYLSENKDVIAYVPSGTELPEGVKVVFPQ